MQLQNVDDTLRYYDEYLEPQQLHPSFPADADPAFCHAADSQLDLRPFPGKLDSDEEAQLVRSSELMEDMQGLPQLPRSLDYLGDWRNCPAAEAQQNFGRLSLGSSVGEQRLIPMDGINVWGPADTLPLCLPMDNEEGASDVRSLESGPATHADSCSTPPMNSAREGLSPCHAAHEHEDSSEESVKEKVEEESRPVAHKRCCNCKKSKCLKLYCECFATQGYCSGCNCVDCHNTPEHMEERKKATDKANTKNPGGFLRRLPVDKEPVVGCNCKRSSCMRNYCCCFKRGGKCGSLCKCVNCSNQADTPVGNGETECESRPDSRMKHEDTGEASPQGE